mmetsp:Transcript_16145/g.37073  ORF Transcript_16145/g.37073 Transcript_16145/m.37073 type:complete len:496 (+) Transcript_16145:196-1683(+)
MRRRRFGFRSFHPCCSFVVFCTDYNDAISHYTLAIGSARADLFERAGDGLLHSQLASYYTNRAAAREKLGHMEDAVKDCQEATTIDPKFVKSYLREAKLHLQRGSFDTAIELYDKGYRINKVQASRLREQALAVRRKYNRSSTVIDQLRSTENLETRIQSTIPYPSEEELIRAQEDFLFVHKLCPGWSPIQIKRAEVMCALGDTEEAFRLVEELSRHPQTDETDASHVLILRAKLLFHKSQTEEAMKQLRHLLFEDPDNTRAIRLLKSMRAIVKLKGEADNAYRSRHFDTAVHLYSDVLSLCPEEAPGIKATLHFNRSSAQSKCENYEQVVADCSEALVYDPNYAKAYIQRANARLVIQDHRTITQRARIENCQKAIVDYEKAIELSQQSTDDLWKKIRRASEELRLAERKDYYTILGVDKQATQAEIKKRYRALAMQFHPDRQRNKSQDDRDAAVEHFREINLAYDTLSDLKRRALYDAGSADGTIEGMAEMPV